MQQLTHCVPSVLGNYTVLSFLYVILSMVVTEGGMSASDGRGCVSIAEVA